MHEFKQNVKQDTEPECFTCCGTTCDARLSVQQLNFAKTQSSRYYSWYLDSQADNEKLRVELVVLKKELKNAKKESGWHR